MMISHTYNALRLPLTRTCVLTRVRVRGQVFPQGRFSLPSTYNALPLTRTLACTAEGKPALLRWKETGVELNPES